MPTYQYACTECGEQLEAVQSFSDPALTECPQCSGKLRKVFNSVGIVFKGSGFYRNDSRAGNVSAEKSGAAGETKSDSAAPAAAPAAGNGSGSGSSGSGSSGAGSSGSGSSGSGSSGSGSGSSGSGSSGSGSGSSGSGSSGSGSSRSAKTATSSS